MNLKNSMILANMMSQNKIMYATIKGSLTENDGVFSGFSSSNYLNLISDKTVSNTFIIDLKLNVVTGSSVQCVYRSPSSAIAIRISSANKMVLWDSVNSNLLTSDTLTNGTYFFRFVIGKNHQELQMSNDGITYSVIDTADISDYNINSLLNATIGHNTANISQNFLGEIDLYNSQIKLDNTKYKLQAVVGYTVVGSPTITDGVVSGFSNSDYLTLPNSPTGITKVSYKITATINSIPSSGFPYIFEFFRTRAEIRYDATNLAILRFYYRTTSDTTAGSAYFVNLALGTPFTIEVNIRGTNMSVVVTQNNEIKKEDNFIDVKIAENYPNKIGGTGTWDGSIDLNKTDIEINNKLWFNGQQA